MNIDKNPFQGPRPYSDKENFKIGIIRENLAHDLVDAILARNFSILYGPSGSGKSSILNAVVKPLLEENKQIEIHCKMLQQWQKLPNSISEIVDKGEKQNYNILILDQLELLLSPKHPQEIVHKLIKDLYELATKDSTPWLSIVFGIREDYLGILLDLLPRTKLHLARVPLFRLSEMLDFARSSCEKWKDDHLLAAQLFAARVDQDSASSESLEINAALAQIILYQRYEIERRASGEGIIDAEDLINCYLNDIFPSYVSAEKKSELLRLLQREFIDEEGRRRFRNKEEFDGVYARHAALFTMWNFDDFLKSLENHRIISIYQNEKTPVYALSHDTIVKTIRHAVLEADKRDANEIAKQAASIAALETARESAKVFTVLNQQKEDLYKNELEVLRIKIKTLEEGFKAQQGAHAVELKKRTDEIEKTHTARLKELNEKQRESKVFADAQNTQKINEHLLALLQLQRDAVAERDRLQKDHNAAISKLHMQHAQLMDETAQRHVAQRAQDRSEIHSAELELKQQYEKALEQARSDYRSAELNLEQQHAKALQLALAERQAAEAGLRRQQAEAIQVLRESSSQEIKDLRTDHESRMTERTQLHDAQRAEILAESRETERVLKQHCAEELNQALEEHRLAEDALTKQHSEAIKTLQESNSQILKDNLDLYNLALSKQSADSSDLLIRTVDAYRAEASTAALARAEEQSVFLQQQQRLRSQRKRLSNVARRLAHRALQNLAAFAEQQIEHIRKERNAAIVQTDRLDSRVKQVSVVLLAFVGVGGLGIAAQQQIIARRQVEQESTRQELERTVEQTFVSANWVKDFQIMTVAANELAAYRPNRAASLLLEVKSAKVEPSWQRLADAVIRYGLIYTADLGSSGVTDLSIISDRNSLFAIHAARKDGAMMSALSLSKPRPVLGSLLLSKSAVTQSLHMKNPTQLIVLSPDILRKQLLQDQPEIDKQAQIQGCITDALKHYASCLPRHLSYAPPYQGSPAALFLATENGVLRMVCGLGLPKKTKSCTDSKEHLDPEHEHYHQVYASPHGEYVAARSFKKVVVFSLKQKVEGYYPKHVLHQLHELPPDGLEWGQAGELAVANGNVLQLWNFSIWQSDLRAESSRASSESRTMQDANLRPKAQTAKLDELRSTLSRFATECISSSERQELLHEVEAEAKEKSLLCMRRLAEQAP